MPTPLIEGAAKKVTGYSAKVRLELLVDGQSIPLAQSGHDRVILAAPTTVAAGPAQVVVTVDDVRNVWDVEVLPHDAGAQKLPIRQVPESHRSSAIHHEV